MEIVTWSPRMTPERAAAENAKSVSLEELLKTSKVVTMHLVAGPGTKDLIAKDQLAMMRPDSILINTSRSTLINMPDLLKALESGRPRQAAIDVFDVEPLPLGSALRNTPNLLATPHLGFVAEPIMESFANKVTETLEAWIADKPIPHPFKP
jgi:phosphoglycerate dehydrogenase-like enzyme